MDLETNGRSAAGGNSTCIVPDGTLKVGDYEAHGLTVNNLHFRCIDLGDFLRLNVPLRRELGSAYDIEKISVG